MQPYQIVEVDFLEGTLPANALQSVAKESALMASIEDLKAQGITELEDLASACGLDAVITEAGRIVLPQ